ncbi:MAG TPA: hypothetical protein VIG49_12755 [Acetobacteraceae bacterium]
MRGAVRSRSPTELTPADPASAGAHDIRALSVLVIMVMAMLMMRSVVRVGTRLRIEWRLDRLNVPVQSLHHPRNHMIGADAYSVAKQLDGQMPIAQMPGNANQRVRLMSMDFHQRLWTRTNPHDAAIHHQPVSIPQTHRLREVQQQFLAGRCRQYDAPAVPTIIIDQHMIDLSSYVPRAGQKDVIGAHQNRK